MIQTYSAILKEAILLLHQAQAEHWASWLEQALDLYEQGLVEKSYQKLLGAFGGMGSINDVFWDLPKTEFDRLEELKGLAWTNAKQGLEQG